MEMFSPQECRRWEYFLHCHRACVKNCRWCAECPGHGRGGKAEPCCERAGEYNGYDSGPTVFDCPKHCSCHD